jgi:hypothetical protein
MTIEQRTVVFDWMAKHAIKEQVITCTLCRNQFHNMELVSFPEIEISPEKRPSPTQKTIPMVKFSCTKCGGTKLFDSRQIGLA